LRNQSRIIAELSNKITSN